MFEVVIQGRTGTRRIIRMKGGKVRPDVRGTEGMGETRKKMRGREGEGRWLERHHLSSP